MTRELFRLAAGILLALLLAGSVAAADANNTPATNQTPPAAWERTYGGLANESLLSLLGETDGGYLLVGSSAGNGTGEELYLVRTDANGTPDSRGQRMPFGPGGAGSPVMADRTADGGIVVVGGSGAAGPERRGRRPPPARRPTAGSSGPGRTRSAAAGTWATRSDRRPTAGTSWPGRRTRRAAGRPELLLLKVGEDGGEVWHRAVSLGGRHPLRPATSGRRPTAGTSSSARPTRTTRARSTCSS